MTMMHIVGWQEGLGPRWWACPKWRTETKLPTYMCNTPPPLPSHVHVWRTMFLCGGLFVTQPSWLAIFLSGDLLQQFCQGHSEIKLYNCAVFRHTTSTRGPNCHSLCFQCKYVMCVKRKLIYNYLQEISYENGIIRITYNKRNIYWKGKDVI